MKPVFNDIDIAVNNTILVFFLDQDPKNRKLDVAQRLKLLHLTSLDLCPKEQLLTSNSTMMAGRREYSVKSKK